MRYRQNHFTNRFEITPGKKSASKMRKEQVIAEYNDAVERGASEQFLTSLYRFSKQELEECNQVLGLLPQDGLARLKSLPPIPREVDQVIAVPKDFKNKGE